MCSHCQEGLLLEIHTTIPRLCVHMALAKAAKEALWLKGLVKELGLNQGGVQLHCVSQSVATLGIFFRRSLRSINYTI